MFYFLQRFALTLSFSLHLWRLKGDVTIFRTAEKSRPAGAVVGMGRCRMLSKGRPWICSFHLQEQAAQIFSIPMDRWHQVGNRPIWCSHPSPLCPLAGPAGLGWAGLSSAQGPGQARLCLQEVILEKLVFIGGLNSLTWVWQVAIKYVTESFVTLIGERCFLAVWKYEGTWCCQAPRIESSKLWNREACNMYSGTKEFSCSWKFI